MTRAPIPFPRIMCGRRILVPDREANHQWTRAHINFCPFIDGPFEEAGWSHVDATTRSWT